MEDDIEKLQELRIHYCFDDDSHSMDAFVRNRAEKEFIETIRILSEIFNVQIELRSRAHEKGSLIDIFDLNIVAYLGIGVAALKYLSPCINEIMIKIFTSHTKEGKLDIKIKEETLASLKLDDLNKELDIEERIAKISVNSPIRKHISNYYKQLRNNPNVKSVEYFSEVTGNVEVFRSDFDSFIISDSTEEDIDDDAEIEIISPVLKSGKYEWKGVYCNEKIQFSMGDSKFKQDVIEGKYSFANGFSIRAQLKITSSYDINDELRKKGFSVQKVYSTKDATVSEFKDRPFGIKEKNQKEKEAFDSQQPTLFDL